MHKLTNISDAYGMKCSLVNGVNIPGLRAPIQISRSRHPTLLRAIQPQPAPVLQIFPGSGYIRTGIAMFFIFFSAIRTFILVIGRAASSQRISVPVILRYIVLDN